MFQLGTAILLQVYLFGHDYYNDSVVGKGVQNHLSSIKGTVPVPTSQLPEMDAAAEEYEQAQGRSLGDLSPFGSDPLKDRQDLVQLRNRHFINDVGSYEDIFSDAVSGRGHMLEQAILQLKLITDRLSHLL